MRLTRDQYESAFARTIGYFTLAVAIATVVEVIVIFVNALLSASPSGPTDLGSVFIAALLAGLFSGIFAAIGATVVAIVLGIGLTALTARLLRGAKDWHGHLAAYFGLGAVTAAIPLTLFSVWAFTPGGSYYDPSSNWLTVLDLAILVLLAACSAALAWYQVWRAPIEADAEIVLIESTSR
jgi:hypothetical protein